MSNSNIEHRYECVEPVLGDQLWRLDAADITEDLRQRLELHLTVCHRCRMLRMADARLESAVKAGDIRPGVYGPPRRADRQEIWAGGVSGLLIAACLALVFIVPPRGDLTGGVERTGDETWQMLKPVSGELLMTPTPFLAWDPLDDATSYRVEIGGLDQAYTWHDTTEATQMTVPMEADLPDRGSFQVVVTPIPAYLASPTGAVTWFRIGGLPALVGYRLAAAPVWLQVGMMLGLVGWFGVGWRRWRRQRV